MSDKPTRLPKWFVPGKRLLAFVDGPRAGQWAYGDRWGEEVRLAQEFGEGPVPAVIGYRPGEGTVTHPQDDRIEGHVMEWRP